MGTIQERSTQSTFSPPINTAVQPDTSCRPTTPSSRNEATQAPYCVGFKTELCWANTLSCVQETSFSRHLENSSMDAVVRGFVGWLVF